MEAALNNFHTLIGTKECKDNRKILIFEWTDTDPYSLPLKAFEEAISTVKHPIPSASWSPFTRQINKKNKTKATRMQHIYADTKKRNKVVSYKVTKDDIERKFGHRNHYVSIRNIENVIVYPLDKNKNNENMKHYFAVRLPAPYTVTSTASDIPPPLHPIPSPTEQIDTIDADTMIFSVSKS
eukprot:921883_1